MGSLKLPHASGNSMSIAAPATNPASDLELKLPATIGTANQVLRNSSTPGTLEFATLAGGKVLQYVYETVSAATTDLTTSGSTELEVIDATITPSSASSKIFVVGQVVLDVTASSNAFGYVRLYRGAMGGTQLQQAAQGIMTGSNYNGTYNPWVLDSPSTTSAQEYTMSMGRASSGTDSMSTEAASHYHILLVELGA